MRSLQLGGRGAITLVHVVVRERRAIERDGRVRHVAVRVVDEELDLGAGRRAEEAALRLPRPAVRIDATGALEPADPLERFLTGVQVQSGTVGDRNRDAG